jgi:3-isopropylmalate/(R)-2-methylmalate dehydratase small subunit
MQPFQTVTSVIAYLPVPNIDTDMIIPKQYLKTIKRTGLGKFLFAEMRYDASGNIQPDFVLNKPIYQNAKILLVEENFGCGSSREHAVWSLIDFGIKVVIAPSFADIFYSNCFKNGLLPITLSKDQVHALSIQANQQVTVDLNKQQISSEKFKISFSLEAYRREALMKGLDEIGETLCFSEKINVFEERQKLEQPWLYLGGCDA